MPSQELARQAAIIRQFVAFLLERIIRLIPHRLIPRTKSFSWKLAVPRPPAILSEYGHSSYMEYRGFDQWIANTRENTGVIVTEVPRGEDSETILHTLGPGSPVGNAVGVTLLLHRPLALTTHATINMYDR